MNRTCPFNANAGEVSRRPKTHRPFKPLRLREFDLFCKYSRLTSEFKRANNMMKPVLELYRVIESVQMRFIPV
jgi:hypothetical protein